MSNPNQLQAWLCDWYGLCQNRRVTQEPVSGDERDGRGDKDKRSRG